MKQVLIKQGGATVEQVPAPQVEVGTILVRVDHSCISVGTELSGVKASGMGLWKRALNRPQDVKKVLQMVSTDGIASASSRIRSKIVSGQPTGYSAAGVVLETGPGVIDIKQGDYVACAGASYAYHAEVVCVPRNLVVPMPEGLNFKEASTVTLGAIALQGVRRAEPTLGEIFVVIGLGVIGQLTTQLLKINGVRVIGVDVRRERIDIAQRLGMDLAIHPDNGHDLDEVARFTDGIGADAVIITASTPSDSVISTAFKMCRKKGRVVLIGDVGLHLNREDIYTKELDFRVSTSYGPGRYDRVYEEQGLDYPVAYVRWTENRNMAEYLRVLGEGRINIDSLISAIYPLDQATSAYVALENEDRKPLMILLSYPVHGVNEVAGRTVANPAARPARPGRIRIALVGAGAFAKAMHLPNLRRLSDMYHIQAIVSRAGHNATATARQFGANYATTEYRRVLDDPEIEAVLIATRHHLHAPMLLEGLRADKHVLVEKPLALTMRELTEINEFYADDQQKDQGPLLLTGFNRRFSPYVQRIREFTDERSNPMILNYRMNVGYLPQDHWVHGEEGGGRNRGEACHVYDLFTYLTDSPVAAINAQALAPKTAYYGRTDNFVVTIRFEDGSVASLTYTALGSTKYPKEQFEVFVDGKVITLTDYKHLCMRGARGRQLRSRVADKGHRQELRVFAQAIQEGGKWPIPLWQQIQATEIALQVQAQIGSDLP